MYGRKETNNQDEIEELPTRIERVRHYHLLLHFMMFVDIKTFKIFAIICRLIEECWHPDISVRPTFIEIICRLDIIVLNCSKQGWWKDTFKFPW